MNYKTGHDFVVHCDVGSNPTNSSFFLKGAQMVKHCIPNTGTYGLSKVVFPTFVQVNSTTKRLALAIFTPHELRRALARGQQYGTSSLKDNLAIGRLQSLPMEQNLEGY